MFCQRNQMQLCMCHDRVAHANVTTTKGSTRWTCVLVFSCVTDAMDGGRAGGAAWRRRERRLRAWHRHVKLTVALEWPRPSTTPPNARGLWWRCRARRWRASCTTCHGTRSLHPRGQWGAVTVGYVAARALLLAPAVLAGGDGLDASTLSFLVGQAVLEQEEEEKRVMKEEARRRQEERLEAQVAEEWVEQVDERTGRTYL